jgi:hypothetical protein
MWNSFSNIKGRTQIKKVREQSAEENITTYEKGSGRWLEETA